MSVEFETDRAPLAGSTEINSSLGGSTVTETPLNDPGADAGQDDAPKRRRGHARPKAPGVLTLWCERCHHIITGTGAGYAYVDLRDAQRTAARAAAGYHDPARAQWILAHRECAPEALAQMSPHFRLWTDRITTTDALLDVMVSLSRQSWFAWSDWGTLARNILAETESASIRTEAEHRRSATNRRQYERREGPRLPRPAPGEAMAADDPRHGTITGYGYGCTCDRCRAANAEKRRAQRADERARRLSPEESC